MFSHVLAMARKALLIPTVVAGMIYSSNSHASQSSSKNDALLLVAFGTSVPRAKKAYDTIDRVVRNEFGDTPVYWAYTSSFIRAKLAKQGIQTDSISQALQRMKQDGRKSIVVQSLHVTNGSEYEEIIAGVQPFKSQFKDVKMGLPLLISAADLAAFREALPSVVPSERRPDEGIVLMGHGNHHGIGDLVFMAAAHELKKGDPNIFVGTVEGRPTFEAMRSDLKGSGVKKVYLVPLMIVAGDHAVNDLAGPEDDSWKSVLEKDGIACIPVLKGLGENEAMVRIFIDHIRSAKSAKN